MNALKEELRLAVLRTIEKEPLLGYQGFETGERERMTSDEGLSQFLMACEWISKQKRLDKINTYAKSYTLKHAVERDFHCYMANGMWISAAIHLGLLYRRYRGYHDAICNLPDAPDCIQMSEIEYADMKARCQKLWPKQYFYN